MENEEKKPSVLDYVDDIRAQFDKISKLAVSLEDWERQGVFPDVEAHHIESARGILAAGLQMRQTLYKVEASAHRVTELYDEQTDKRLSSFFDK